MQLQTLKFIMQWTCPDGVNWARKWTVDAPLFRKQIFENVEFTQMERVE